MTSGLAGSRSSPPSPTWTAVPAHHYSAVQHQTDSGPVLRRPHGQQAPRLAPAAVHTHLHTGIHITQCARELSTDLELGLQLPGGGAGDADGPGDEAELLRPAAPARLQVHPGHPAAQPGPQLRYRQPHRAQTNLHTSWGQGWLVMHGGAYHKQSLPSSRFGPAKEET